MMATRCMARLRSGRPAGRRGVAPSAGRRSGRRRDDRLRRQPGLEEPPLALGGGLAGHRAERAPAAPTERPAAERVGLEADHEIDRQDRQADPALIDARHALDQLEPAAQHDKAQERPPQPIRDEPDRREESGDPAETVLDEDKALRPVDAVGRRIGRLMHGKREHGGGLDGLQSPLLVGRNRIGERLAGFSL